MTFVLRDTSKVLPDGNTPSDRPLSGWIENETHGVSIHVEGFGCCGMDDGHGAPIFIELYEGKLRAIVFADINSESPTHVIDLSGAADTARKEP